MAASIGDVAARAGVSAATVSRALRGLPNVAAATREKVLRAAEELDYVVNPNASRLATGRSHSIGMIVPHFTQWYFTQCVAGAESVLTSVGYDVLLYNVSGPESRKRFFRDMPFRKRVDGVIVIDLPLSGHEINALADTGVPVVTVGVCTERFPSVSIDNVAAAVTATRHLANLGHREIGLIKNHPDDALGFTAPIDRQTGYRRVLEEHAIELRPDMEVPGNFTMKGGAEAMAHLMSIDQPPTGVFAESDEMAIGALKTLKDSGLRVPEDVSIIGFDDHEMAEYVGLTTIAQPVVEQGGMAADMLLERIRSGRSDEPGEPDAVVMPTKLTVRRTTGPRRAVMRPVASR